MLRIGDASSFSGFRTAGDIATGNETVVLESATFATLGAVTTIGGGTLRAANGVAVGSGDVITGAGTVAAAIAAGTGSLINLTGDLALGDPNAFDGFFSNGRLDVGDHEATLHDADHAKLGALTTIDGGALHAPNGVVLAPGHSLAGNGLVSADFDNLGSVIGPDVATADVLEFSGRVTGDGTFGGRVEFSGVFSPGNSSGVVTLEEFVMSGVLDIEIGGLAPGTAHDRLVASGAVDLTGGTLQVSLIALGMDVYSPQAGDTFDIIVAATIDGMFADFAYAAIEPGLFWSFDVVDGGGMDIGRLSVAAVPLPPMVAPFVVLAALVATRRR